MPFNIELRKDIQSEENGYKGRYKVQTRRGSPARIICWDKKDPKSPIVALVEDYSIENELSYRNDGMYYPGSVNIESNADLFLVDTWEPKFGLWDKVVRSGDSETFFEIVAIDYVSKRYMVVSDNRFANRHYIGFDEQDNFEFVKPVSGFNYNEGTVMRCVEGPDKGSLWLRCHDKFVKSDGVTFSSDGLYYSVTRKVADKFFAKLDKNGYKWSPILGTITKKPKFKVGDRVKMEGSQFTHKIVSVRDDGYMLSTGGFIEMRHELLYSLVTEESELTEFEKELANCLYKSIVVCNIETLAKECTPKLLELAKKEIIEKLKEE